VFFLIILKEPLPGNDHFRNKIICQRYEYCKMKCGSYLRSDLERHFKDICRRYHILSGPDDSSLKHAFLASIPRDLTDETFRLFKTRKEVVDNQSLGTIFHQVLEALNKMCDQHK
jgi:hypothetical protein